MRAWWDEEASLCPPFQPGTHAVLAVLQPLNISCDDINSLASGPQRRASIWMLCEEAPYLVRRQTMTKS